jgi:hypothetical protein
MAIALLVGLVGVQTTEPAARSTVARSSETLVRWTDGSRPDAAVPTTAQAGRDAQVRRLAHSILIISTALAVMLLAYLALSAVASLAAAWPSRRNPGVRLRAPPAI